MPRLRFLRPLTGLGLEISCQKRDAHQSNLVGISAFTRRGGAVHMTAKHRKMMFANYPDVVCVDQLCAMLGGIGKKTAYDLLRSGEIRCIKTRLESLSTLVAWAQQFLHDRKYLCASGYGGKRRLRCEADRRASHPGQRSDQHLVLAPVLSGRRELAREQGNTRLPEIRETEYFQVE